MKLSQKIFLSILILFLATSCKVEFSPNAAWRDVPVVYCVIDPDEDTVWARVQRCYLGEGNIYSYSSIFDSINYPQGDISVKLLAWKGKRGPHSSLQATQQIMHTWNLTYTLRTDKDSGTFSSPLQPLYYASVTGADALDTSWVYELLVIKSSSGDTIARAQTTLIGYSDVQTSNNEEYVVMKPSSSIASEFGFRVGCRGEIKFYTLPRARAYQPIIRFFYSEHGDTLHLDIPCDRLTDPHNYNMLSTKISQDRYLSYIREALIHDTAAKKMVNNVDVKLMVCNEELNAYLNSTAQSGIGGQESQPYSNIVGGTGIFASRRAHISVNVPCDSNIKEGYLSYMLNNLGVGLQ